MFALVIRLERGVPAPRVEKTTRERGKIGEKAAKMFSVCRHAGLTNRSLSSIACRCDVFTKMLSLHCLRHDYQECTLGTSLRRKKAYRYCFDIFARKKIIYIYTHPLFKHGENRGCLGCSWKSVIPIVWSVREHRSIMWRRLNMHENEDEGGLQAKL